MATGYIENRKVDLVATSLDDGYQETETMTVPEFFSICRINGISHKELDLTPNCQKREVNLEYYNFQYFVYTA